MGFHQWQVEQYRRKLDVIMRSVGFEHAASIMDWQGAMVRYSRANVMIEVGRNIETNFRLEIWLRRCEADRAMVGERTWTAEDISLGKFCERHGLGPIPTPPQMRNRAEMIERLDGAIDQLVPFLLKAIAVIDELPEL